MSVIAHQSKQFKTNVLPLRVLVTGGSGYVGRLILPLLAKEFSITVFDLKAPPIGPWKFISGDVQDQQALTKTLRNNEALLYMATGPFYEADVVASYDVNAKGLHLALEAAKQAGIRRVVYTSTVTVYEGYAMKTYEGYDDLSTGATDNEQLPPSAKSVYGLTKHFGEQICRFFHDQHHLPILVLRLFAPVSIEEKKSQPFKGTVDCRTSAPDLARAIAFALKSTHKEFEIIHITGDVSGRAYHHEKAKRILNWEPETNIVRNGSNSVTTNGTLKAESLLRFRFPGRYEQLLQAALFQGAEAIQAWESYSRGQSSSEIENDFENEPHIILPLLYRNLETNGQSEKLPPKYKGVYRYTWTRNQNLIHDVAQTIKLLSNAGIETLIFKGAALLLTHYRDYGVRMVKDVDIVVRPEKITTAVKILEENGWKCECASSCSREFVNTAGNRLDLHWFLGTEVWRRSIPTTIEKIPVSVVDSTDQLDWLWGIYGWNMLWVTDSFVLMNQSPDPIDWNRLVQNKNGDLQILALKTALCYLSVVFKVKVPEKILGDIMHCSVSRRTYFNFIPVVCSPKINAETPIARLKELWSCYWKTIPSQNFVSGVFGFPLYLRYRWKSKRWWKFPFAASARLIARCFKIVYDT